MPSSLNILDNIANHECTNNATTNILIRTIYGEPHEELLWSMTHTTQTTHYATKQQGYVATLVITMRKQTPRRP